MAEKRKVKAKPKSMSKKRAKAREKVKDMGILEHKRAIDSFYSSMTKPRKQKK